MRIFRLYLFVLLIVFISITVGCTNLNNQNSLTTTSTSISSENQTTNITTVSSETTSMISTIITNQRNETENIIMDFDLEQINYQLPTKSFSLHSMISNNVIFQQNKEIRVFGQAQPKTVILVKLTKDYDKSVHYQNYVIVPDNGEWIVTLPPMTASFDTYTLTVSDTVHETTVANCLIGEVWIVGGQSNMELKVKEMDLGYDLFKNVNEEYIRIFYQTRLDNNSNFPYEPAYDVSGGVWKSASSYDNVAQSSAIGFSFALKTFYSFVQYNQQVPIAIINTPIGGSQIHSWLPRAEITESSVLSDYVESLGYSLDTRGWNGQGWNNYNQVSANFNKKIAPLTNFNIKGVAWYQGESDAVYSQSVVAIKALIDSWSECFNKNDELLYFALIQIAPYDGTDPSLGNSKNNYWYTAFANHRRAQFDVVMDPTYSKRTFLVPIYDIDLKWDVPSTQFAWANPIHPVVKLPVGQRLSKMIMSFVYFNNDEYLAPVFESLEMGDNTITITFRNVGSGLTLFKDSAKGVTTMEVILKSGLRVNVSAEIISSNQIQINGVQISDIQFVAYSNFSRNEQSNLASSNLIPAIPFVVNVGDYS